jgi:hypothetical protein
LFIARYPTGGKFSGGPGALPASWNNWTFWQYGSTGAFPGDQDVFNGSLQQLQALGLGTSLVRTASDPTVYVVSGSVKYPISDLNVFNALYPLGGVAFVSQSFLDGYRTGPVLGRFIRSPGGQVYYIDVGAKFQFMTCADVSAYGVACGDSVVLTQAQVDALRTGPHMTTLFTTTDGKEFLVSGGSRREVLDEAALASVPHPEAMIPLYEEGISNLPYAAPVMEWPSIVQSRADGGEAFFDGSRLTPLAPSLVAQSPLASWPVHALDGGSLGLLPRGAAVSGFMTDGSGRAYVAVSGGRIAVAAGAFPASAFVRAPDALLAALPVVGSTSGPLFVVGSSSPSVYLVGSGVARKAMSWDAISQQVSLGVPDVIWSVPDAVAAALPVGTPLWPAGELVKGSSVKVYVPDGKQLLPLSSFDISMSLGLGASVTTVSDAAIASTAIGPTLSSVGVKCGSDAFVGTGNGVAPVLDGSLIAEYGIPFVSLSDAATCASMPRSAPALTQFLRDAAGKIYYIDGAQKHPIQSWERLVQLGGVDKWVQASAQLLNQLPTGTDA